MIRIPGEPAGGAGGGPQLQDEEHHQPSHPQPGGNAPFLKSSYIYRVASNRNISCMLSYKCDDIKRKKSVQIR